MKDIKRCSYYWLLPLLILVLGTIAIVATGTDMKVETFFHHKGATPWPVGDFFPFHFAYAYGELLGWIPAIVGLGIILASVGNERLVKWRKAGLFLILALAVGPGLVVNAVFKENWNRPRPRQIEQFGGDYQFQQPLVIGPSLGSCKSFPSGHAAMGFIFMAPYFILLAKNRRAALMWLYGGTAYGLFVSIARNAQGAHWPSDVLWSFGVVYFTCYALARIMRLDRIEGNDQPA
jgi:lipid A 4'-phosphatase